MGGDISHADFDVTVTSTDSGYLLQWGDGLEIEIDLGQQEQSALSLYQGTHEGEFFVNDTDAVIEASFSVEGWADYGNTVGLFIVNDKTGAVTDPLTGEVVQPGEANYTEIALSNLVIEQETGDSGTLAIAPGTMLMPFIVADGDISDGLDGDAHVYFPMIGANSDGFDHVRLLGDNTFGFEDLHGGGDQDFNDIVLALTPV